MLSAGCQIGHDRSQENLSQQSGTFQRPMARTVRLDAVVDHDKRKAALCRDVYSTVGSTCSGSGLLPSFMYVCPVLARQVRALMILAHWQWDRVLASLDLTQYPVHAYYIPYADSHTPASEGLITEHLRAPLPARLKCYALDQLPLRSHVRGRCCCATRHGTMCAARHTTQQPHLARQ